MAKQYFIEPEKSQGFPLSILSSFKLDDLILLGLIFILLNDNCEDKELLLILAFLFISGW